MFPKPRSMSSGSRWAGIGPVLARLIPELADPVPQPITSATAESPESEQFQLFDSVASLLREIAEQHPLILVLDDLHWADAPTLLLLRHVVRATEGALATDTRDLPADRGR